MIVTHLPFLLNHSHNTVWLANSANMEFVVFFRYNFVSMSVNEVHSLLMLEIGGRQSPIRDQKKI